jgi:hypothetical protein
MFEMHVPRTDGEHYYCTLCSKYYIKITDPFQTIRKHYFLKHDKKFVKKPSLFSVDIKNELKNEIKIIHAIEYNIRRKNDRTLNNITHILSTMYCKVLHDRNLIIMANFIKLVDASIIRYEENDKLKGNQIMRTIRSTFDIFHAVRYGAYGCNDSLVQLKDSLNPVAGRGVFSNCFFKNRDYITVYDGQVMNVEPLQKDYALQVGVNRWVDGLREPLKKRGLGSFINREQRNLKLYKNCKIISVPSKYIESCGYAVVVACRDIDVGDELYTTYSKGYRMSK